MKELEFVSKLEIDNKNEQELDNDLSQQTEPEPIKESIKVNHNLSVS